MPADFRDDDIHLRSRRRLYQFLSEVEAAHVLGRAILLNIYDAFVRSGSNLKFDRCRIVICYPPYISGIFRISDHFQYAGRVSNGRDNNYHATDCPALRPLNI